VIIEGWFNRLVAFIVRFVPGILLIPAVGWFFRVRDAEGNPQWPKPLPDPTTASARPAARAPDQDSRRAS
jgi:hypothetical protein